MMVINQYLRPSAGSLMEAERLLVEVEVGAEVPLANPRSPRRRQSPNRRHRRQNLIVSRLKAKNRELRLLLPELIGISAQMIIPATKVLTQTRLRLPLRGRSPRNARMRVAHTTRLRNLVIRQLSTMRKPRKPLKHLVHSGLKNNAPFSYANS